MCGIYGEFFNGNNLLSAKSDFLKSNDKNYYRGPDMEGYWSNERNCQLGFRRLSILDLSEAGNQPMVSAKGKYVIVFNGEIYNFQEVKEKLIAKGYLFKTTTDTEVLVNSFEFYGIDKTLDIIDGMFAISLYDVEEDRLFLIRDFAGIKPLFYSLNGFNLVFGSRYDQISKHKLNRNLKIDQKSLKLYLKKHYMPAPFCILERTHQVEPGQIIEISNSLEILKKFYWRLPEIKKTDLISDKKRAVKYLKNELGNAVEGELIADVPLGSFLSGGIDSPLITYFAKQQKKGIQAYSIGSDSKVHDESVDAQKYAELIDCDLNLKMLDAKKSSAYVAECMTHLQEPFADFSIIPTYALTKGAKEFGTVMLSGDGGDELFFGYERFYSVLKNLKWTFIPKKIRYYAYGFDKVLFKKKHINDCILAKNLSTAHQGLHSRFSEESIDSIFPNLKPVSEHQLSYYNYPDEKEEFKMLNYMRNAEFYDMMQKTLTKVDRMSMANSLEVRVPFLKKSFIEAASKIDPYLSYGAGKKKQILKDLLHSLLPKSPINNVKRGFSIPLGRWLKTDLKQSFEIALFDENFIDTFEISKSELSKLWREHQTGIKDHKWSIFTLYSLSIWLKELKK